MGRNDYRGGGGGYHQGAGGGGWGGNRGGGRGGGGYAGGGGGGGGNRGGGYSGTAYQQQGRGYQGGSGARGGGGGAGRQQEPFWRDVVRADVQDERPRWVLSSYGHVREGPNDLTGDISPEEVRWANMQAGQRGMSASQLGAEHKAAEQARVQLFNQLARASKPPSLGGPALPQPSATISGLQDATASISGFSTSVGFGVQLSGAAGFAQATQPAAATAGLAGQPTGFGQAPQAGTGSGQPMFGQPPVPQQAAGFAQAVQQAPKFGQPQLPSAGFGQAAVLGQSAPGGFGGAFGAVTSKPVFGSKPGQGFGSTPFGQPAGQPSFSSTPFGQPATQPVLAPPGQPTAAGQVGGNGAIPFAGAFVSATAAPEQAVAPAGQHQAPANAAGVGNGAGNADAAVWTAAAFEKGKIPEHAPPSVYCH